MYQTNNSKILYIYEGDDYSDVDFDKYTIVFFMEKSGGMRILKDQTRLLTKAMEKRKENSHYLVDSINASDFIVTPHFIGYVKSVIDPGTRAEEHQLKLSGYSYKTERFYDDVTVNTYKTHIKRIVKIPKNIDGLNKKDHILIRNSLQLGAIEKGFTSSTKLKYDSDFQYTLNPDIFGRDIGPIEHALMFSEDDIGFGLDSINGAGFIYRNGKFSTKSE